MRGVDMDSGSNNFISSSDLEKLLRAHDGDCALLYLWTVFTGKQDLECAARDLCMTRAQVDSAAEKLQRMLPGGAAGLSAAPASSPAADRPVLPPADELPEYTSEEIESVSRRDSGFRAVLGEAERILGKQLTRHDLSRLLGLYNHLGLPADVIFVLLHFCSETSRGPAGAERKPTMNYIERQAFLWVNQGITTVDAAEEYAEKQRSVLENEHRVKKILEIYDRRLTTAEKEYISEWLQMGFSDDAIALAYERTVDNIGKRSVSYMNSILRRWNESGMHTAAQVAAKEMPKQGSQKGKASKPDREFQPTEF